MAGPERPTGIDAVTERVKEQAEAEGVSQAEIVDRAFRAFFFGGEGG